MLLARYATVLLPKRGAYGTRAHHTRRCAQLQATTVYQLFVNDFDLFSAGVLEQLQTVVGADVKYLLFSNTTTSTSIFEEYMAIEMKCGSKNGQLFQRVTI